MAGVNIPLGRRPAPEPLDEEEAAPIAPPPPPDPEERRRQVLRDQSAAKRADTAYAAEAHDLLHGPEGLFARAGFDAVDAAPDAHAALGDARARALETLTSPVSRALFTDAADERDKELKRRIGVFLVDQERTGATDASLARQAHAEGEFKRAFLAGDTDGAAAAWRTVGSEIAGRGRAGGASDEAVAAEAEETRQALHADAVEELAKTDPVGAQALLNRHRGAMDSATAARLEPAVRDQVDRTHAAAAAEAVVAVPKARRAVADRIRARVQAQGLDARDGNVLVAMGMIESSLDVNARNGRMVGLYQFMPETFSGLGYTDINDTDQQIDAAIKLYRQNKAALAPVLGRDPTAAELYLAHQQGLGGAKALLKADRSANAVETLNTLEYYRKKSGVAKKAIVGNGGREDMTVGEFLDHWNDKTNQKLGGRRPAAAQAAPAASAEPGPDLPPDRRAYVESVADLAHSQDPAVRDLYAHTAAARWDELAAEQGERARAAWDEAEPLVRGGVPFHRWPTQLMARLSPDVRDGVMRAGTRGPEATDWAAYGRLRDLARADPVAFRAEQPAGWLPHLARPEHEEMARLWKDSHDETARLWNDEPEGGFAPAAEFDDGADYDERFDEADEDETGIVKTALRKGGRRARKARNAPWDWTRSPAMTVYGETSSIYPLGIDATKSIYDVGNYDPKSAADLRLARAMIAVAASRNPDHQEYDASGDRNVLVRRQWGVAEEAGGAGRKLAEQGVGPDGRPLEIPSNLNHFFVRNTSKHPKPAAQHPGARYTTFYKSLGPFRSGGGGDAGKGEVYIDFYLEDPDARRKPAKPKPVSPGTKRKQTA